MDEKIWSAAGRGREREKINLLKRERDIITAAKKSRYKISNMRKSIYLLTTTPTRHTHLLLTTPIHSTHSPQLSSILNLCKVQSMDDNCGEWVECMGVAGGCGEQEAGWLVGVGVVSRR